MQLSPHFSLEELTRTDTGLDNTPDANEHFRLIALAQYMETVRKILGGLPIDVHSGFRSQAVNDAVGGVSNSAHRLAFACDFECPEYGTPYIVAQKLQESALRFDQLIYEGTWVHVSRDPQGRGMLLTHVGANYVGGITHEGDL